MRNGSTAEAIVFFLSTAFMIFQLTGSSAHASIPGIVGQDEGGVGDSPVSFNTGRGSEMSQGHRVNVNAATGNLAVKHTDLVIPTKGKDIVIERTYNSIRYLHGVEYGFDLTIESGNTVSVTSGVCWINGERLKIDSDSLEISWINPHDQGCISKNIVVSNYGGSI